MMGSTIKRRKIAKYCRDVMASLNDFSEKYRESLSSVLGNAFVFGNKEEKGYVRDTRELKQRQRRRQRERHLKI